jgi:hypothetical protein
MTKAVSILGIRVHEHTHTHTHTQEARPILIMPRVLLHTTKKNQQIFAFFGFFFP